MIDGYTSFLIKFKEIYPETYLEIIEFPDATVVGWINEISNYKDMITLQHHKKVKDYFKMKIAVSKIMLESS